MTDKEFTKIISDLALALESAGVKDDTLKTSIDRLFDLKDIIYLRQLTKDKPECRKCRYISKENTCSRLTYDINHYNKLDLPPLKVNPFWHCQYYIISHSSHYK